MSKSRPLPMQLNPFVQSIPQFWNQLVPAYQSKVYGAVIVDLRWDPIYAKQIVLISKKRAANRCVNYLDNDELVRVSEKLTSKGEASIRFGAKKEGHGYSGERGDFCLVGGVVKGRNLALFYRSLELIGGFAYDLTLLDELGYRLGIKWNLITIYTCKAFTFALKGNSNEKLFPKLQEIMHDET